MVMMMMMMYHWKDHPHHYAFRMGNDGVLLRGKRRLWRRLMTMMLLIILMPMMQRSWIMVIAEDGGDVVPCLFSLRHPFRWNIYPLAVTGGAAKTTNEEKCCYWVIRTKILCTTIFECSENKYRVSSFMTPPCIMTWLDGILLMAKRCRSKMLMELQSIIPYLKLGWMGSVPQPGLSFAFSPVYFVDAGFDQNLHDRLTIMAMLDEGIF